MRRIDWQDIARAARETSEALAGKEWVLASIKARTLLADLADDRDDLVAERDALRASVIRQELRIAELTEEKRNDIR